MVFSRQNHLIIITQNISIKIIELIAAYRFKTIDMKKILVILFLLVSIDNLSAQSTDPNSFHSARQLTDSSYSLKKPNGDSTIFLFQGANSSSQGSYKIISTSADSTALLFGVSDQPVDTLEIWGNVGSYKGSYQISGIATLLSGQVTVNAPVSNDAKIFVSVNTPSGSQGFLSAPNSLFLNGISFVIKSSSATENSTVNWQILYP